MSKAGDSPAPVRPAASIVILRDGAEGIETFMLQRNQGEGMAFSGALVFPGGKVDDDDSAPEWQRLAPAQAEVPGHAFWVAGVRETFEEAGFLLARRPPSPDLVDPDTAQQLVEAERAGRGTFRDLIARENLVLATDQMIHFGHWITPPWAPKRFDTHFFLVAAPVSQHGSHDDGESEEGLWIRPAQALAEAEAGRRTLVPVTRFSLELLASWPSVSTAVAVARKRRILTVMPRLEKRADGRWISIPEEAGYLSTSVFMGA
jgi:8-oxo-dGTP pyrophosphatase MutT (NUDIX family)